MNQKTNPVTPNIYASLGYPLAEYMSRVDELSREAEIAFETLLSVYLTPEAFAVLVRFHSDVCKDSGLGYVTLQTALNDLGDPEGPCLEVFQRTLKAIKKERKAA